MKGTVTIVFILFFLHCQFKVGIFEEKMLQFDPDMFRNVSELISSKGYPVEDYRVQTSDGFLLSMQRIPHGRKKSYKQKKRGVVLLVHGLIGSSADWVMNFPKQSLGFILADERYDVWLGNTRGNVYSRKHVKYTPEQGKFWDFSTDEIVQYDLPAMIDHILKVTREKQIYYIGHSVGSSAGLLFLSESPEYNKRIKLLVAFAPIVPFKDVNCWITYLFPVISKYGTLLMNLGFNELFPQEKIIPDEFSCNERHNNICKGVILNLCKADELQINKTRQLVYSAHIPAGTSFKTIIHTSQIGLSHKISKFDYGERNMDIYGQKTPPEYDLSHITTPIVLFWAMNDWTASPDAIRELELKLKSMIFSYCIPDPMFTHSDFTLGMTARKEVYVKVLSAFQQY